LSRNPFSAIQAEGYRKLTEGDVVVVGGRAGQFKVSSGAVGARDRRTSVRATNERQKVET
jgi:cold shock CspA family protein